MGSDWGTSIVGVLSDVQDFTESLDRNVRERACSLLEKELGYIQHLSFASTMLNLSSSDCTNLARCVNSKVTSDGNHTSMLVSYSYPFWHLIYNFHFVPNHSFLKINFKTRVNYYSFGFGCRWCWKTKEP